MRVEDLAGAGPDAPAPHVAVPGGVDVAALQRAEQEQKQWVEWQGRMQADFDSLGKLQGSAALRVVAVSRPLL